MQWSTDAEKALKKVPFFVRKRVRARVEQEARHEGKKVVALAEVKATKRRFLNRMQEEVRGYQLETCFGPSGCPKRAVVSDQLYADIEALLKQADLRTFLKERVAGDLRFHHEFRVTLADCPNACSQPQIKDIGVIGAVAPAISEDACSGCDNCVAVCPDRAIALAGVPDPLPVVDYKLCQRCGLCVAQCPTQTLAAGSTGYRIQLGGKLGRRPRLGRELPGIYSPHQ